MHYVCFVLLQVTSEEHWTEKDERKSFHVVHCTSL